MVRDSRMSYYIENVGGKKMTKKKSDIWSFLIRFSGLEIRLHVGTPECIIRVSSAVIHTYHTHPWRKLVYQFQNHYNNSIFKTNECWNFPFLANIIFCYGNVVANSYYNSVWIWDVRITALKIWKFRFPSFWFEIEHSTVEVLEKISHANSSELSVQFQLEMFCLLLYDDRNMKTVSVIQFLETIAVLIIGDLCNSKVSVMRTRKPCPAIR